MSMTTTKARVGSILVTSASAEDRQILTNVLNGLGHEVHTFSDGEGALRAFESLAPDLIVLDNAIPAVDGFEVCRRIKASANTRTIPVIFLINPTESGIRSMCFAAGAVDYICKPLLRDEILARVTTWLQAGKYHLQDDADLSVEDVLRRPQGWYRRIVDTSFEGIWVIGPDENTTFVNARLAEMLGYREENILGKPIAAFMAKEELPDHELRMKNRRLGISEHYERRFFRKDGQLLWTLVSASPVFDARDRYCGSFGMVTDITERKLAEKAVWESSQMLSLVLDHMPSFVFWKDRNSVYLGCNVHFAANAGLASPADIIGKTDFDLPWKDAEAEHYRTDDRSVMERGIPKLNYEETQFTAEGHVTDVRTSKVPLRNADGAVIGILGTFEDITERKRAERSLAETEAKYRALVEESLVGVYIIQNGRFAYANNCMSQIFGYSREEVIGRAVEDLVAPEDRDKVMGNIHKRESGQVRRIHYTFHGLRKDGTVIHIEVLGSGTEYNGRPAVLGSLLDITEQQRAEQERLTHLRFFEAMDRVNRCIQANTDLEGTMSDVLDVALQVFDCDRAFLLYPLDVEAPTWYAPMERTRPEYPGIHGLGAEAPMTEDMKEKFRALLGSDGPVKFGPQYPHPLPTDVAEQFGIKSLMSMALYPKAGKPWEFGIQQCSHARTWNSEEEQLLQETGRRLEDALTTQLIHRNLAQSEQRYRIVFENSPVALWEEDLSQVKALFDQWRKDGVTDIEEWFTRHPEAVAQCAESVKIVDVNTATLALHKATTKGELLAGLTKTFAPDSFEAFRNQLTCLWNGRFANETDAVVMTLEGDRRDVNVRFSVSSGDEATLSRVLVSIVDVTERRRTADELAEEHKKRERLLLFNEALLSSMPTPAFYKDKEGRYLGCNRAFTDIMGVSSEEIRGKTVFELWPSEHAMEYHRRDLELAATETRQSYEFKVTDKNGVEHPVIYVKDVFRDEDGLVAGIIGAFLDITDRKRAEVEIRNMNLELEARVAERTTELKESNGELEAFVYSVSHDLQAPLRHINSFLALLKGRISGSLDEKSRHYMDTVTNATTRMEHLINDLLSFSRMGRKELSSQVVDLNPLLEEVIRDQAPDLRERHVEWKIVPLPLIRGDGAMLKVVLTNLVANALKFTRPRDPAVIEIGCTTDATEATIYVRDNGVGFDPAYADKLFGVFQRLHRLDEFEGTGIGLASVRRIIARHGGRTWAHAKVDQGATIFFTLPTIK
jgi:PAS domain S-box-containing protein